MNDIEQYRALLAGNNKAIVDGLVNEKKDNKPATEPWTGKVVNNEDPERLGRVQIRVIGFYENINDDWLPWAIPDIGYIGGKNGSQIIPEIGTIVRGYFDHGDIQKPIYNGIAFNAANSDSAYTDRKNTAEYPHKMVLLETDQGDFLTLNRKNGEMAFVHRTGASIFIDSDGNIKIQTGTNSKSTLKVEVNGNTEFNVKGSCKVMANKDIHVDALGQINLGSNPTKTPVNNLSNCPICGIMLSTQQQVMV